jgi:hypothetical protein
MSAEKSKCPGHDNPKTARCLSKRCRWFAVNARHLCRECDGHQQEKQKLKAEQEEQDERDFGRFTNSQGGAAAGEVTLESVEKGVARFVVRTLREAERERAAGNFGNSIRLCDAVLQVDPTCVAALTKRGSCTMSGSAYADVDSHTQGASDLDLALHVGRRGAAAGESSNGNGNGATVAMRRVGWTDLGRKLAQGVCAEKLEERGSLARETALQQSYGQTGQVEYEKLDYRKGGNNVVAERTKTQLEGREGGKWVGGRAVRAMHGVDLNGATLTGVRNRPQRQSFPATFVHS